MNFFAFVGVRGKKNADQNHNPSPGLSVTDGPSKISYFTTEGEKKEQKKD